MATTPEASDADMRNRLRGEPGVTPEDTRSELLQDGQDKALRDNLRGEPGVAPEDTHSELLAAKAKEERKEQEADSMRQEREATARAWSEEQAKARAARDVADHADLVALGKRGEGDSFYLRTAFHAAAAKGEEAKPVITTGEQAAAVNKGLQDQLEDDLRRRKAREQEQAGQGLNSVDVRRSGKELERGDFIVPRRITQAYTEMDGKFYAKDSNRVMFEDKGEKLVTSTTNKEAVADMVAYAKAKQWDSLKLSGSQEFRREAWLQAESQGIKTQGYTPKQADLAALETLRQERSTNAITPLQERKAERETVREETTPAAPRHDLNKNQAAMHVEASKFIATNMQALQKQPGMADKSVEDLTKLAYWRGIVAEENKLQPKPVQDEAIARFDKQAVDPQFLKRLNQVTEPKIKDKTTERVQKRDTHEQSL
ncbi:LPD7 domain-containing protein [Verminephrobacter eiseniae]|uniref:Large polyvalent protein-associated domain-containing protein n=1 Tax=Verminephrobacter eiseniae (strain EF01-2) TaxID=391735 RepID=A1WSU7_VEREI|nr:LPD7 domain-containing protein [Verminephrobacter eiseniae]ABM60704.1 hypothetical protein Veis_5018 [Verminephrobacter eiseniae EF01-2]